MPINRKTKKLSIQNGLSGIDLLNLNILEYKMRDNMMKVNKY